MNKMPVLLLSVIVVYALFGSASNALDQGKIVFTHGPSNNELWVVQDDGTNPRRILAMPSPIYTPRWSPNGSRIAFVSPDDTNIKLISEDGSGMAEVPGTIMGETGLTWNAEGTGLVYGAFCTCCEYLRAVNLDGSNNRTFYQRASGIMKYPDARPGVPPALSHVVYFPFRCGATVESTEFFTVEMVREGGADFVSIPWSPNVNVHWFARWSPDGSKLVTPVRILTTGEWAIEILDPFDPAVPRTRLVQGPGYINAVDFGCSADTVFFTRQTDGFRNVWRVRTDGSEPVRVTNFASGEIQTGRIDFVCMVVRVNIDIKPGSFPNSINLGSSGSVPVAILSTENFDAATVDPSTVTLASAPVKMKGKGTPMASLEDVNGDGRLDLVVHVNTEALQLSDADTEAVLEGTTFGGKRIRGVGSVSVVP